jgi:hypothetical protein
MLCDDIWHYICDYLNVGDTIALSQVNKNLKSIKQYKSFSAKSFIIVIKNNIFYYYTNNKIYPWCINRKLSEIYCKIRVNWRWGTTLIIRNCNDKDLVYISICDDPKLNHGCSYNAISYTDFYKLKLFLSENNISICDDSELNDDGSYNKILLTDLHKLQLFLSKKNTRIIN